MTPMVPLAMFGWLPFSLWLFSRLNPRHAVIAAFALGWMFLPQYSYGITGLPDYSKVTAIGIGILLGTFFFNPQVLSRFRLHVLDIPLIVWCLVPFFTSISNDLGPYDGISGALNRSAMWGLPYFIGRLYFDDRQALGELAFGLFIAGLIYMPFCLWEVVMSPRLHKIVYGWHPHDFGQAKRGGGFRPVVFMEHGLMVGMWTVTAFLSGFQLLRSGWLVANFPKYKTFWMPAVLLLLVTVILNKSTGAMMLMVLGVLILYTLQTTRKAFLFFLVLILPLAYVITRGTGYWDGQNLINAVASVASEERVGSLAFRMDNENVLSVRAKERPLLGWGAYGRSFVRDEEGKPTSVPDGLWILAFGQSGMIGLSALLTLLLLPPLLFIRLYPPRLWGETSIQAIAANPLLMVLFTLDSLFNAMFNPLILLLAGGITSLWLNRMVDMVGSNIADESSQPQNLDTFPTRLF
ncbi:MAG: O-antigen ligase domain-containing protein [Gammaproteobacteria bacterium]|nr:O-antigen ligase domain-containing protein [Gammaproteobacteria bacterium]